MILCHCALVSDRAVRRAVADGAADLDALAATCSGAGARCGGCRRALTALLSACSGGEPSATPVRVGAVA